MQLLEYLYTGKVDCIYIDPPYNTGAKDWKYNNNYVDSNDTYRHSKWLSMMQKRLRIAKKLLNPKDSVLIVTIDEKEYLHLGCLLEEMFPNASIQMITDIINPKGVSRGSLFSRAEEYIYYVFQGNAAINLGKSDMLRSDEQKSTDIRWASLQRSGSNSRRFERPNLFYPLFFDIKTGRFMSTGNSLSIEQDRKTIIVPDGQRAVFPLGRNNDERTWQLSQETFLSLLDKGYVKFGNWQSEEKRTISYLSSGLIKQIENDELQIMSHDEDGSVIINGDSKAKPLSVWNKSSHSASDQGSSLINSIFCEKRFSFPKSLYATHDALWFFVANKPNALILDFFAGSGTTLHAVNLLNAEDGGHRRCIMVTNNEVSDAEAKELTKAGHHPGDPEWEKLGIAHYVTWPRTVCSIEGHDVNGKPLNGNYGYDIEKFIEIDGEVSDPDSGKKIRGKVYKKTKEPICPELVNLKMADGFKANAAFFKLSFLDKNAIALGMQFKEMLPTLWMKAGAHGKCPELDGNDIPKVLILPKNRFAVLTEEDAFPELDAQLAAHSEIDTVYIITDYEAGYSAMAKSLKVEHTYQLYRDYLDNFRINTGRNET